MRKIFQYISALGKKIKEAFKNINMPKTIFENDVNNLITAFTSINKGTINHINLSEYNVKGYYLNITFHNQNNAIIRVIYNPETMKNDYSFQYVFKENSPLINHTTHNDYLTLLLNLKNQVEPLYKKYMVNFYKVKYN